MLRDVPFGAVPSRDWDAKFDLFSYTDLELFGYTEPENWVLGELPVEGSCAIAHITILANFDAGGNA